MIEPSDVFKCAKMKNDGAKKKQNKKKDPKNNLPVLDLQRHLQLLVCLFMPQEIAILDL